MRTARPKRHSGGAAERGPGLTHRVKNQLKKPMLSFFFFFFSGSSGVGVVVSSLSPSLFLSSSVGGGVEGESASVEHAEAVTHLSDSLPAAAS